MTLSPGERLTTDHDDFPAIPALSTEERLANLLREGTWIDPQEFALALSLANNLSEFLTRLDKNQTPNQAILIYFFHLWKSSLLTSEERQDILDQVDRETNHRFERDILERCCAGEFGDRLFMTLPRMLREASYTDIPSHDVIMKLDQAVIEIGFRTLKKYAD